MADAACTNVALVQKGHCVCKLNCSFGQFKSLKVKSDAGLGQGFTIIEGEGETYPVILPFAEENVAERICGCGISLVHVEGTFDQLRTGHNFVRAFGFG